MRTYIILKFSKRSLRTWSILKVLTLIIYNCSTQLQFSNEKRLYMQQITRPHFNISALGCFAHRTMCVSEFTTAQWKEILTNLRFVVTHSSLGYDLQKPIMHSYCNERGRLGEMSVSYRLLEVAENLPFVQFRRIPDNFLPVLSHRNSSQFSFG